MKRIGTILASFLTILISVSTGFSPQAYAASNSLGVNPRRDYTVQSGEKKSDTLFVTNLSKDDDLNISINVIDFRAENETGAPDLLLDAKQPTKWSLKPFITIPSTYSIPAGKSVEVPFTISIPKSVGAGSYYSAIRYSAQGADGDSNVSLSGSSVSLMFVKVPGEARSSLLLNRFGAFTPNSDKKTGAFSSFFSATPPKYLAYRLENKGNVAEQPQGSVVINDIFGKQVKLYEKANPSNFLVLVDQTRRYDLCMNPETKTTKDAEGRESEVTECTSSGLKPGYYTAKLALTYGNEGGSTNDVSGSASFWYLPVWFIIVLIVALLAIGGLIWFAIKKIRNRGSHKFRGRA